MVRVSKSKNFITYDRILTQLNEKTLVLQNYESGVTDFVEFKEKKDKYKFHVKQRF